MDIRYQVVAFDAAYLAAVSTFWAGVLGGTVDVDDADGWHMVMDRDGTPRIGVQLAPNHVPPEWPDGDQQQQVHLDLWVADFTAAHAEVMALEHAEQYASEKHGRVWGPVGRFGWKFYGEGESSPLHRAIAEAESQGDSWPPVKAGLFKGSVQRFKKIASEYSQAIARLNWC